MLGIQPPAVVFDDRLIAPAGPAHRLFPGDVQAALGLLAHPLHRLRALAQGLQLLRHGVPVFLYEEARLPIVHILGGAAAPDQDAGQAAGRRLPHHQAVGIKAGGEEKEVRPAVPGPHYIPVMDGRAEKHPPLKAQLPAVLHYLIPVRAASHEHHTEIPSAVRQLFQPVQDNAYALIPHHPAKEQEHRHPLGQVIVPAGLGHLLLFHPAPGQVHPVGHYQIVPLIAQRAQVLPRPAAHRPHLVAGGDVLHQDALGLLLQQLAADGLGYVYIELGMIGHHQRGVYALPKQPGQKR